MNKEFIRHHNTCPGCKNSSDNTWTENKMRTCSCGFRWIPCKPTKENLNKFNKFIDIGEGKQRYIFQ